MRMRKDNSVVVLLLCFAMLGTSLAGQLSDFEDAVAKPVPHSDQPKRSSHYDNDDDDSWVVGEIVGAVFIGLVYGTYRGVKYVVYDWWAKPDADSLVVASPGDSVAEDDYDVSERDGFQHNIGTVGMPYVRFDYRWQYLDSDVDANDFLLEAGYKYLAFYGRVTQYEDAANVNLDIEQYYAMVRTGGSDDFYFPGSFQVGAGLGWYSIEGDQIQDGPALTVPVMLYPNDWFGVEFRPAWAVINDKVLSDYDVSASLGHRFAHLRLGYRWLWVQHEGHWLDGPYAGLSFSF